ncbi:MAG: M28 family peptidase [Bacillota bacterium]|nr:M28 family peptidase [Bacillota bacterium]MDW7676554.1 M28 family peptidase [Bacillota bacterium]
MRGRKQISVLLVCLLILSMAGSVFASPSVTAFDQWIVSRISVDRMMNNLDYLVHDIGVRVASSPEEYEAARFIAKELEKYGYEVEIQPFDYRNRVAYMTMLEPDEKQIDVRIGGNRNNAVLTGPEGITAQVIDCGMGGVGDFPAEVEGNIALIKRGQETFANMLTRATAAGAVGVIIQNNDWRIFTANVGTAATIPYVTLNEETGELLKGDNVVVNLRTEEFDTSWNVIATRKPNNRNRDSGNIVIFSAHYDTVPTAPGASDNGTGVVGLLELARIYSGMPIDTEIRFLACGAEEVGLVGSRYYVNQMSADEISRTVANYNMDMIGTAGPDQTTLFANVLTGFTNNPEHNLVSFTALEAAERLGYADLVRMPYYRGASDHVAFAEVGIAAVNFIYRDPVTIALEPWYHQPYDTFDRVSPERLLMAVEIIAAASHDVVRPETPNLIKSMIRQGVERPLMKDYQDLEPVNIEILSGEDL